MIPQTEREARGGLRLNLGDALGGRGKRLQSHLRRGCRSWVSRIQCLHQERKSFPLYYSISPLIFTLSLDTPLFSIYFDCYLGPRLTSRVTPQREVPIPDFSFSPQQIQETVEASQETYEYTRRANVQTLQQMFPTLDAEILEAVLEGCNEDLGIAIDCLLEM